MKNEEMKNRNPDQCLFHDTLTSNWLSHLARHISVVCRTYKLNVIIYDGECGIHLTKLKF